MNFLKNNLNGESLRVHFKSDKSSLILPLTLNLANKSQTHVRHFLSCHKGDPYLDQRTPARSRSWTLSMPTGRPASSTTKALVILRC